MANIAIEPGWEPAGRATAGGRVVHRFDFEERASGNFESMPRYWKRVQAEGFPHYTDIGFDDKQFVSGQYSFKMQLNGGSAAAMLATGAVPVTPGAQYLLTAQIRTAAMVHSRARIATVFLDQHNRIIESTLAVTRLFSSNDQWTAIELDMGQAPLEAAWITLRLDLLQPEQFQRPADRQHVVELSDLYSAAYFDDLVIYQVPRAELRTQNRANVIRAPEIPEMTAKVIDFSGKPLHVTVDTFSSGGKRVDHFEKTIHPGHPGKLIWQPALTGFGWYYSQMTVHSEQEIVGRSLNAFSWLPPVNAMALPDLDRLMIVADDLPLEQRPLLPLMLEQLPGQSVLLSLWRSQMTHDQLVVETTQPDPLIGQLLLKRRSVALSLAQSPQELALAAKTDASAPLDLLTADQKIWQPYLDPLLVRYGNQVTYWQIGRDGVHPPTQKPDLAGAVLRARAYFEQYAREPRLILPWAASQTTPSPSPQAAMQLDVPTGIRPQQIPDYQLGGNPGSASAVHSELHYHLQTLPPGAFGHPDREVDLALRMIYAWRANPQRLAIDRPWSQTADPQPLLLPDPLLGVWTAVGEHLAGRRYVGDMKLGAGIECQMFDGPRGGALVAWNRSSPVHEVDVDLFLGDEPILLDIHGNVTRPQGVEGKHRIRLTHSPQFIEGIDLRLARLRASFRFEPDFVPSIHSVHRTQLVMNNPWPRSITGQLRLVGMDKWDIQPRLINFSITAGQDLKIPLELSFPINELAGVKSVAAHLELDAERVYKLELAAPLTIGLPDLDVQPALAVEHNANGASDVVVTLTTINRGTIEQSFYAFAAAPSQPRVERIIASLKQDQAAIKRFRFPNAQLLSGKNIRVGLRQTNGPAILNYELAVP